MFDSIYQDYDGSSRSSAKVVINQANASDAARFYSELKNQIVKDILTQGIIENNLICARYALIKAPEDFHATMHILFHINGKIVEIKEEWCHDYILRNHDQLTGNKIFYDTLFKRISEKITELFVQNSWSQLKSVKDEFGREYLRDPNTFCWIAKSYPLSRA